MLPISHDPAILNPQKLVARKYQEEIFAQAQNGNIIAYLQTGSGKTLISVLLIRWMSTLEKSKDKIIIFIVPKVTLVEQQAEFIHKETGLRVCQLHGALSMDLGDRPGWKKRFEGHDVFVMTAQLFLNILTHSLWSIGKVSLIVFDECHHARKNHPYIGILREYFEVSSPKRPKIFGMTASPFWNEKDPTGSLATLEANLDAKIVGVRDHVDELMENSPKPLEVIQQYPFPPENYDFPDITLLKCLNVFDAALWDRMDIPWSNIENRYHCTWNNLGPYSASLYLFNEMHHHTSRVLANSKNLLVSENAVDDEMDIGIPSFSSAPSRLPPIELFDLLDILDDFEPFFPSVSQVATPLTITLDWCSPKIRTLVDVLRSYHSPTFQGIIFVEQRQIAFCLSRLLEGLPELKGLIRCAYLTGQGVNGEGGSKPTDLEKGDPVQLFRDRTINILIATSVAEEGLDFPACDLVVRFDPLQHLVGYVQSRGRARNATSTYVIMIQKDDVAQLQRYQSLRRGESQLSQSYRSRQILVEEVENDDLDDETDPIDMADRERYVVPSTGAVLTYDNAIDLLSRLCALIPRDAFTPAHVPQFSGDFQARMRLPPGLPLHARHLSYVGYPKRSKKEAKRSVAFQAVKRLFRLNVFDQYLLPTSTGDQVSEGDGTGFSTAKSKVPFVMTVDVKDPWCMGPKLWNHHVFLDGHRIAGLITGTCLPPIDLKYDTSTLHTTTGKCVSLNLDDEREQRGVMNKFTSWGVWTRVTGSPTLLNNSLYLVPLTSEGEIDFESMERVLSQPRGNADWSSIEGNDYERLFITNYNEYGRIYRFLRIRDDLTPLSPPSPGSLEYTFPRYYDFWVSRWTRKKRSAFVPLDGPLIEVVLESRKNSGAYPLHPQSRGPPVASSDVYLLPQGCCRWIEASVDICRAFEILPVMCRRITDVYRIRCARFSLSLPPIRDNLLIEAFTLPQAALDFSNQRMETLGDAVLKLCTTVHLLNHYQNRHEGQLSALRRDHISNQYLLGRARDIGLEHYLSCEMSSVSKWRYSLVDDNNPEYSICEYPLKRSVTKIYPRRNLQDCMEAVLGAGYLEGGMPMALRVGTALGLAFGGPLPWTLRYCRDEELSQAASLFTPLEERLGYQFRHNNLIVEAVTHPSFATPSVGCHSYQRLEFLGDAVIDFVVIAYLYHKYPKATSHQLALPRTKAVCAQTLATLSVRKLNLHKIMLINNVELSKAIDQYAPVLQRTSGEDIVNHGWKFDPPKAISDVFESVIGAVFVDTGYDYERTAAVVEHVMNDVLSALTPSIAQNPVSILIEWVSKEGCRKLSFEKKTKLSGGITVEGIAVSVHNIVVIGPIISASLVVARFLASERAFAVLKDTSSKFALSKLCDCREHKESSDVGLTIVSGIVNGADSEDSDTNDAVEVHTLLTTPDST